LKKRLIQYVAQKLSRLQATDGKETAYGDGALPLRQARLEGLGALIQCFCDCPAGCGAEVTSFARARSIGSSK
jgi:hypothetical protein